EIGGAYGSHQEGREGVAPAGVVGGRLGSRGSLPLHLRGFLRGHPHLGLRAALSRRFFSSAFLLASPATAAWRSAGDTKGRPRASAGSRTIGASPRFNALTRSFAAADCGGRAAEERFITFRFFVMPGSSTFGAGWASAAFDSNGEF